MTAFFILHPLFYNFQRRSIDSTIFLDQLALNIRLASQSCTAISYGNRLFRIFYVALSCRKKPDYVVTWFFVCLAGKL